MMYVVENYLCDLLCLLGAEGYNVAEKRWHFFIVMMTPGDTSEHVADTTEIKQLMSYFVIISGVANLITGLFHVPFPENSYIKQRIESQFCPDCFLTHTIRVVLDKKMRPLSQISPIAGDARSVIMYIYLLVGSKF